MTNFGTYITATLEGAEANVALGQAMYINTAGEAVTCGVNDDYRFVGVVAGPGIGTWDGGDDVLIETSAMTTILADGASTYYAGTQLECGAAGVMVPQVDPIFVYTHTVSAAEEAAAEITLPDYIQNVLDCTNDGTAGTGGDYTMVGPAGSVAAGSICQRTTSRTLVFKAADIKDTDGLTFTYTKPRTTVGVCTVGGVAPATIQGRPLTG